MKSFDARWNNALAVVVLTSMLSVSFAPSASLAALSPDFGPSLGTPGSDAFVAEALASGGVANSMCATCQMNPLLPLFCPTVPCYALSGPAMCVLPATCMAISTLALGGAAIGLGLGIVKSIFFDGDSSGNRSGASVNGTPLTGTAQCSRYYQVTVPTSDQCAIYVPPVSGSLLNNSNQILNSFGASNVSDALLVQSNKVSVPPPPPQNQPGVLPSGAKGNISITSTSATIQAGIRSIELNVETASFFGANVPQNINPQGFLERMCLVRQWQSPIISYGIPTSLFDNLCSSKSLRVGILPEISAPAKQASKPAVATTTIPVEPAKPAGPYVVPRAVIRATPASVSLGSRSTISWASQGVESCTETSPDGSFNSNTLRGEASTVPISSATTFVISCIAPDGSHVTDSVTVNLAI